MKTLRNGRTLAGPEKVKAGSHGYRESVLQPIGKLKKKYCSRNCE